MDKNTVAPGRLGFVQPNHNHELDRRVLCVREGDVGRKYGRCVNGKGYKDIQEDGFHRLFSGGE